MTDGRYHVAGVPLHQTEFARDPLHPATTDDAFTLLRDPTGTAKCVPPGSPIEGFILGQAGSAVNLQT